MKHFKNQFFARFAAPHSRKRERERKKEKETNF